MLMCRNVSLQLRAYELRLRRVKPSTHQIAPARFQSDGVASYASKPSGADAKGRNAALDAFVGRVRRTRTIATIAYGWPLALLDAHN
jgi:hypothetical protein